MAAEKETMMMLKVDLDCPRCYKKVKKLLCSIGQVKDQIYDKNENTVKIKVVGSCPEIIRDKICCKGGKTIKDIQIMKRMPPPPLSSERDKAPAPEKKQEKTTKKDETPPPPRKTCCSYCYTWCEHEYGYWFGVPPPPPPPGWWGYYSGCTPGGYYYINYEYPSACVIM